MGWDRLSNGDLLAAAEDAGFELLLTGDKNLRYQQNLSGREIAIVLLEHSAWPLVRGHIAAIVAAVERARSGSFFEVEISLPPKKPFLRV